MGRKRKNDMEKSEQEIASLEEEKERLCAELSDPAVATNSAHLMELHTQITGIEERLDALYEVWEKLDALLNRILARKPLREYGMKAEDFPVFADSVIEKQQRLLGNNYVFLSREDMLAIYHSAL